MLDTELPPGVLARSFHEIESRLGRERIVRWDARVIDIDMLLYGPQILESESLTLPHPRMSFRKFVLEPAVEVARSMVHPTSGWTIAALLEHLRRSPRRVTVTATQKQVAQWLVAQLCETMNCVKWVDPPENTNSVGTEEAHRGIKFQHADCGKPLVDIRSPEHLSEVTGSDSCADRQTAAALTIYVDQLHPAQLCNMAPPTHKSATTEKDIDSAAWSSMAPLTSLGMGPLARISDDNPETVLQEAKAALRCVWPDLS